MGTFHGDVLVGFVLLILSNLGLINMKDAFITFNDQQSTLLILPFRGRVGDELSRFIASADHFRVSWSCFIQSIDRLQCRYRSKDSKIMHYQMEAVLKAIGEQMNT